MRFIPLRIDPYYGKALDVSWDAAIGLRDVGAEFFLVIRKDDKIGSLLRNAVVNFIAHRRLYIYVVQVFVDRDVAAADHLAATMVPQLRYYRAGEERGRHRGVAYYESLQQLLAEAEDYGS